MRFRRQTWGFSLIEVVIAIGIVAGGVAVILGLLPGLSRQSTESGETQVALRFTDAVRVQMETEKNQNGFNALASSIPVMTGNSDTGLLYIAERDGTNLRPLIAGESPARDQFYLITVRRFSGGVLAYDSNAGYLAANVVVSWPYRILTPAGLLAETSSEDRSRINFNVALNR